MKRWRIVANQDHVPLWAFEEGTELWMIDFDEDDPRNVAKRIWSKAHLNLFKEKAKSNNVFFFVGEAE